MEWDLNHQPHDPQLHTLPTELPMTDRNMWTERPISRTKMPKKEQKRD